MFLLSGMREAHAAGATAPAAVHHGFATAARVVVAAALIMIGIFGNGAITGVGTLKIIAFALGVLLDAFIVRRTLIPAAMFLLGRAAWWRPNRPARLICAFLAPLVLSEPSKIVVTARLQRPSSRTVAGDGTGHRGTTFDLRAKVSAGCAIRNTLSPIELATGKRGNSAPWLGPSAVAVELAGNGLVAGLGPTLVRGQERSIQ